VCLDVTGAPVTVTDGAVTLALNQHVTCTITNNDQTAHLTLVKTVINDSGGTAAATAWTLTATGPTPLTGVTGTPDVDKDVNAGTYTLSESGGPAGYTASAWVCLDAAGAPVTVTDGAVTLAMNQHVTCTITNDDQTAHLTLDKILVNDNGGTAAVTDWTLSATGTPETPAAATSISGTDTIPGAGSTLTLPVNAGTYTLAEASSLTGYTASAWRCVGGTLAEDGITLTVAHGATVTCTITNDDAATSHLKLVKTVVNDNGGTAAATAWTLTATGPTSLSGVTGTSDVDKNVDPGTYTLAESDGPAGYTAGEWSCTITSADGTRTTSIGSTVVVPVGGSAVCSIVNDDKAVPPPTPNYGLTVVKAGFEVNGATWTATDGTVTFGDTVGYTIRVTAEGNTPQTNVTITDVIPAGMTLVPGSNVCLDGVVCTTAYDAATRTLTWTVATLQPGASFVASFQATVDAAPAVAPGETYTWTGVNVAAVISAENPKVPSNPVTVTSSKTELPKTGADGFGMAYLGLLLAALGGGLMFIARRRDEEETA